MVACRSHAVRLDQDANAVFCAFDGAIDVLGLCSGRPTDDFTIRRRRNVVSRPVACRDEFTIDE